MSKDLVSIVLAVHNGEKYLSSQIESILNQTYDNFELIICDDLSSDCSLEIVKKFGENDNRIKIIENAQNLGIVSNFLSALKETRGKYICFSDQDDIWMLDKIQKLVDCMDSDADVSLVYSDLEIYNDSLTKKMGSFWGVTGIGGDSGKIGEKAFLKNLSPGCAMMFNENIKKYLDILPMKVPFMHDHLVFILASLSGKIKAVPLKLVKYRQHEANNIGAFYDSKITRERILKELGEKIDFFKHNDFLRNEFTPQIENIERVYSSFLGEKVFPRVKAIKYFVFLRNNKALSKLLGVFDCLLPGVYKKFKNVVKDKEASFLKQSIFRGLFIVWAVIVVVFFVKVFVMEKILN